MKIVVIMGSPRKGNTFRACEEFKELVQEKCEAEFEYVWLKDADIKPCKGCFVCFPQGEERCPNRGDDVREIVRKMEEADGVVFATPVYSFNVSGLLKTFIDRISYMGHRPQFVGKKAFVIATVGGYGMKFPLDYMAGVASQGWGFDVVGTVGLTTPNGDVPQYRVAANTKLLEKAAGKYSRALNSRGTRRPGLKSVIVFHASRGAISQVESVSPDDFRYWTKKGWLAPGAKYYIDVPVNPLYLAIARTIGKAQMKRVRKDLDRSKGCSSAVSVPLDA